MKKSTSWSENTRNNKTLENKPLDSQTTVWYSGQWWGHSRNTGHRRWEPQHFHSKQRDKAEKQMQDLKMQLNEADILIGININGIWECLEMFELGSSRDLDRSWESRVFHPSFWTAFHKMEAVSLKIGVDSSAFKYVDRIICLVFFDFFSISISHFFSVYLVFFLILMSLNKFGGVFYYLRVLGP